MELLEHQPVTIPELPPQITPPPDVIDPLQRELAQKAKSLLGYDKLRSAIELTDHKRQYEISRAEQERDRLLSRRNVRILLKELEIEPYSHGSVYKYKEASVDKAEGARMIPRQERIPWKDDGRAENLAGYCGMLIPFIGAIGACAFFMFGPNAFAGYLFLSSVCLCALTIVSSIIYEYARRPRTREVMVRVTPENADRYEWIEMSLKGYTELIPDFPIDTAIRIKERLPEAEFFVDVLCRRRMPTDEPFLILKVAGEKHYVEVWDEPDFEKQQRRI